MWKNHFKIAWRNLVANRSYALINVIGLTIGLTCFLLIMMYVRDESGYDSWNKNGQRIHRMALERIYPERSRHYAMIPAGYGQVITTEFPEVEAVCRLYNFEGFSLIIKKDQEFLEEKNIMWADSNFFDLFSLPVLSGHAKDALKLPNSVVLTASAAKKYFGTADPVGQTLDIAQNNEDLNVTAVCADVPKNSHLEFDLLVSATSNEDADNTPNFINFSAYTYLMLHPQADPSALEAKFPDLVIKYASGQVQQNFGVNYAEYQRQGNGYRYFLQPLTKIYLDSNLESEIKPSGSRDRIYFFVIIAILILIIACVNFVNLSTARSINRSREIGIRKTIGSDRNQIIIQILVEAVTISLISAVLAGMITYFLLPGFNQLTLKAINFGHLIQPINLLMLFGAGLLAGLLSGIYPALNMSLLTPVDILRGKLTKGLRGTTIRNGLIIIQFAISIFLIVCTLLVYRQMEYTQQKTLGFEKDNLITIQGAFNLTSSQTETFKHEISRLPGVKAVGGCTSQPGQPFFGLSFKPNGAQETTTGSGMLIDEGYIECMKMEVVSGRSFSPEFADSNSLLINEAAAREMGLDQPVGTILTTNDEFLNTVKDELTPYTIVGVIKDFHFQSLHHTVSPLFFIHHQRNFTARVDPLISIRMAPGSTPTLLKSLETMWAKLQPERPFRYAFLDQDWANLYEREMTSRKIYGLFSILAIIIGCLGLLALAAFMAEKRTKEIGIRKVVGANISSIVALLSRDFIKLVGWAFILASPLAWWVMHRWLENFAYRITITWWVFPLAGLLALSIALLTVSYQSIQAALVNPVQSLRSDG